MILKRIVITYDGDFNTSFECADYIEVLGMLSLAQNQVIEALHAGLSLQNDEEPVN